MGNSKNIFLKNPNKTKPIPENTYNPVVAGTTSMAGTDLSLSLPESYRGTSFCVGLKGIK